MPDEADRLAELLRVKNASPTIIEAAMVTPSVVAMRRPMAAGYAMADVEPEPTA